MTNRKRHYTKRTKAKPLKRKLPKRRSPRLRRKVTTHLQYATPLRKSDRSKQNAEEGEAYWDLLLGILDRHIHDWERREGKYARRTLGIMPNSSVWPEHSGGGTSSEQSYG